jgi:putative transposase
MPTATGSGIEPICTVLSEHGTPIAPSTYYQRAVSPVSAAVLADAYAANTLVDLHRANRWIYGVRKLWHTARRAGHDWGRDQVGRLMGIAGMSTVMSARTAPLPARPADPGREPAPPFPPRLQ